MSNPLYSAFEGILEQLTAQTLTIRVGQDYRVVRLDPGTVFWKGSNQSSPASFQIGDNVLIRLDGSGKLVKAWANLTRVRGLATPIGDKSFAVRSLKDATASEVIIDLSQAPTIIHATTPNILTKSLPAGAYIDMVGVKQNATVLVTQGIYATLDQRVRPPSTRRVQGNSTTAMVSPDIQYCPISYTIRDTPHGMTARTAQALAAPATRASIINSPGRNLREHVRDARQPVAIVRPAVKINMRCLVGTRST